MEFMQTKLIKTASRTQNAQVSLSYKNSLCTTPEKNDLCTTPEKS